MTLPFSCVPSLGFGEIGALHAQNKVKKSESSAKNRIFNERYWDDMLWGFVKKKNG